MRSVVDRNVVMRRIHGITQGCPNFFPKLLVAISKSRGTRRGGGHKQVEICGPGNIGRYRVKFSRRGELIRGVSAAAL
jgi:hypothetical protein